MRQVDPAIIARLRAIMREDPSVSQALKSLHAMLPSEERSKIALIEYAKEAYCLSLHEAGPIAGWNAEGTGEIQDERLDELVMPAVAGHRSQWDSSNGGSNDGT